MKMTNFRLHTSKAERLSYDSRSFSRYRVNRVVMLLDPSNLDGLFCFAAGIYIDFAPAEGQNMDW